jgi:hypothetical protein
MEVYPEQPMQHSTYYGVSEGENGNMGQLVVIAPTDLVKTHQATVSAMQQGHESVVRSLNSVHDKELYQKNKELEALLKNNTDLSEKNADLKLANTRLEVIAGYMPLRSLIIKGLAVEEMQGIILAVTLLVFALAASWTFIGFLSMLHGWIA